jgi:hypothetical protein
LHWEDASRRPLPGFCGHGQVNRGDTRIHASSIHLQLDVEPLKPYPLIIVEKRDDDRKEESGQRVQRRPANHKRCVHRLTVPWERMRTAQRIVDNRDIAPI